LNTIALNTIINKHGFKIIFHDFKKYYLCRGKITFTTINPWINKTYSIKEREDSLENSLSWLLYNQSLSKVNGFGTFNLLKGWSVSDPVTSGNILSSFINYYFQNPDENLLQKIAQCSDWLVNSQNSTGYWQINKDASIYNQRSVIDASQIIIGLLSVYSMIKKDEYLNSAIKAGEWLCEILSKERSWNNSAFLIFETSHSLADLFLVTNNFKYKDFALHQVDTAIDSYLCPTGMFDESNIDHSSFTIAGIIDSLFRCGLILEQQKYLDISFIVANSLFSIFNKKKYLPGKFDMNWKQTTNYIDMQGCAKFSIVLMNLYEYTKNIQYLNSALKINDFLISCQCKLNDKNIHGAIPDFFPFWGNYSSDWNSRFLLDALLLEQRCLKSIN
jgi:hypothetical protein